MMSHKFRAIWPPVLIAVLFLAAWQLLVVVQDIKPYLLPAPSLIASNFLGDISLMWSAALYTATTAFLGLVFGTMLGIVAALLAQRCIVVNTLITPLADVTRGLVQVKPVQLELMRSMNASHRTVLRTLRVPNAIPFFFTGLKIAAPLAVIAALVAEYFGGPQEGLGSRIASAAANTAYGRAWAYVVASILAGLVFYLTVVLVEKWTTPWTGRGSSV